MKVYDAEWNEVEDPDPEVGRTEPARRLVAHHEAVPERERIEEIDYENPIKVYPNGGKDLRLVVLQEYAPAVPAWDEYEDCLVYTPYTPEELDARAVEKSEREKAAKEAAERAAAEEERRIEREKVIDGAPERFGALEDTQLDHDEAIAALYESQTQAQLDADEAITALYETMTGGSNE